MANNERIRLLAVVGPTASGKSALAVALAERLGGEIVSCDSMQIYRRMDVGTAKPSAEERRGIAHHLIDAVEPQESFSCADYVTAAREIIAQIASRGALPILCGGTGLYLDALLRGGGFEETEGDPALREKLFALAREQGNHALHARLAAVDPESAAAIHENNIKRVVRALEIFETTGMTKTQADLQSRQADSPYDATVIGLRYEDREVLYARIDKRVDAMLADGLLEETRSLLVEGVFEQNATAAQAIGYKELLGHLRGEQSLAEATEVLKRATRRYAKRQLTWFGAKDYVKWIDALENGSILPPDALLERAIACFREDEFSPGRAVEP
ncbi:MAG: tRNA (adenosine(37)-N6)-dimethylallyltransferase MiaA [Clostridia bacterium]|nr:tRNA (adenosine(37)-N6)-dimethylallyltransferase MiaA [Clostridia bacterium]